MFNKYVESAAERLDSKRMSISFKFVDHKNDYFFMHGLSKDFYEHLTESFDKIQNISENDLRQQKPITHSLDPKSINFQKSSQDSFPIDEDSTIYSYIKSRIAKEDGEANKEIIEESLNEFIKNAFEIKVSKNLGRIHGFVYSNIFYIVWFDPAHNLFLSKHMGQPGKLQLSHEIEKIKPICPEKFQEYNQQIQELDEFIELIISEIDSR